MSTIERIASEAIVAGIAFDLASLGGEDAVYADTAWTRSVVFGDVTEVLLGAWDVLRQPASAYGAISFGLRENEDRDALGHAVDAIATKPPPDLRPIVLALDKHARNEDATELLRAEAASGILRFSLADAQWQSIATAALYAIEDFEDEYASSLVSRLAAVAWEHFHDSALIGMLERRSKFSQASYERGVIGLAMALEREDLSQISMDLKDAESWLQRAVDADNGRRDARVYLLLTQALNSLAENKPAPKAISCKLREEAVTRHLWDEPAPGRAWLLPPHEAEQQWIPLVDRLVLISHRLSEPSWMDVSGVLADVVKTYMSVRSVRPRMPGIERVIKPAIEAAFVRERGLLAHLTQWLDQANDDDLIDEEDATTLRSNIERLRSGEGKGEGTSATGQPRFPRRLRPD